MNKNTASREKEIFEFNKTIVTKKCLMFSVYILLLLCIEIVKILCFPCPLYGNS